MASSPALGPCRFGDHDGTIQGDDRRIVEFHQPVVQRQDLPPVRGRVVPGRAMTGGDAGLQMILGDFLARRRLRQMKHAPGNHRLIPARPVLFLRGEASCPRHPPASGSAQCSTTSTPARHGFWAGCRPDVPPANRSAGSLPDRFPRGPVFHRSTPCNLRCTAGKAIAKRRPVAAPTLRRWEFQTESAPRGFFAWPGSTAWRSPHRSSKRPG